MGGPAENKFKKFLPFVILLLGILVLVGVFLFVKNKKGVTEVVDEKALIEVALADRPVASLTPTDDGHWLKLMVSKINIPGVETMDYELLYKLPDGRTQGVPGTINLKNEKEIERDLLLGSESSGKFRYDEGVEGGTITLRFRNTKGKLVVKFSSEFSLLTQVSKLASKDGDFKYTLDKESSEYFVVMETFGFPGELPDGNITGPYGVFSSATKKLPGEVDMAGTVYHWDGSVRDEISGASTDIGIFVASK